VHDDDEMADATVAVCPVLVMKVILWCHINYIIIINYCYYYY